jgi:hypothetical protein
MRTGGQALLVSALHHALHGLRLNEERFVRHADRIARLGALETGPEGPEEAAGDVVGGMVGLKIASLGYRANLAVVRTADEMLGTLIDTLA